MDSLDFNTSSSSYGRACINCARNKSKCVTREAGACCERCQRLNKECSPSTTTRRRNLKRQVGSKHDRLEEKIDGLISIFRAQPARQIAGDTQTRAIIFDPEPSESTLSSMGRGSSGKNDHVSDQTMLTPSISAFESTGCPAHNLVCPYEPTVSEAQGYLDVFTTKQVKYFPFVNILPDTTAEQLRQERPFLWLCIMAISTKIIAQQQALNKRIRDLIAQRLLLESEHSLDLLLGLLAFIGWSNLQVQAKPNLSLYAQLAKTMVFDLSLNKPKPKSDQLILCSYSQTYYKSPPRSMEERRALLGCFLITSIISSFVQKIDALRWTPHCEECLQVISSNPEGPNDETLVQLIRLQLLVEKVGHWQEETTENTKHMKTPSSFYIQALRSQLQEVKLQNSFHIQSREVLLAHYHSTNLTINETAHSSLPSIANNSNFQQLDCLYSCLDSIKSWFDVFFGIPPADYIGFPFSIFSQLSHCLTALYKLSSLKDSSWPSAEVRNTADVLSILDMVIYNLAQVSALAGLDTSDMDEDIFTRTAKRFRSIKAGWEAKLDVDVVMATGAGLSVNTTPSYDLLEEFPEGDWTVDVWFSDILMSMKT